jgi:hypothetical protein
VVFFAACSATFPEPFTAQDANIFLREDMNISGKDPAKYPVQIFVFENVHIKA